MTRPHFGQPIAPPRVRLFIEGPVGKWDEMPEIFVTTERRKAFDGGYPAIMAERFATTFPRISKIG